MPSTRIIQENLSSCLLFLSFKNTPKGSASCSRSFSRRLPPPLLTLVSHFFPRAFGHFALYPFLDNLGPIGLGLNPIANPTIGDWEHENSVVVAKISWTYPCVILDNRTCCSCGCAQRLAEVASLPETAGSAREDEICLIDILCATRTTMCTTTT